MPKWPLGIIATVIILANVSILLIGDFLWQFAFSFILLCLIPGFLLVWVIALPYKLFDLPERIVLSVGVGYAFLILGALWVHYLPGPITPYLILGIYDAIIAFLLALYSRRWGKIKFPSVSKGTLVQILLLIIIASFFRLTYLGYSEFQGDEARAMLRAAEIIRGEDDVLFLHKKGPVEILIPAVFYALSYRTNEFVARLPFAIANLTGVIAVYLLGRAMFGEFAGFAAALIMAIEGYTVAFSRIVQYQSIVFLMTVLAVLCFYKFLQSREGDGKCLTLGGLFAGIGLLSHYEAFLAILVGMYLIFKGNRLRMVEWKRLIIHPLAVFSLTVFPFYIPFVLHPHFRATFSYIAERRLGGGIPYNNLPDFFVRSTFYNSTYYIVFMILLMMIMLVKTLISRQASVELKLLFVWFIIPCIFYFFLVRKVRTHYYVMFTPWSLIAGTAIDGLWNAIRKLKKARRLISGIAVVLSLALIFVFSYYIYIVFIRHNPEYKRTYPEYKSKFYLTVYSELPKGGYFGFPYRAGWKVIGYLYNQGLLSGDYYSNEEDLITTWYTRGELRCADHPEYYFIAKNVQDPQSIPMALIEKEYHLAGIILVDGEPKLWIYKRSPPASIKRYDLRHYAHTFDIYASHPQFRIEPPLDQKPRISHPMDVNLENKIKLLGFSLAEEAVDPGGTLHLTLYWQALTKMGADYHVFVHLGFERLWGQKDRRPVCDTYPTYRWQPGEVIIDRYFIHIAPDAPPGQYPLRVGMYDVLAGGKRLKVLNEAGEPVADSIFLTKCLIKGTLFTIPEIQHPMWVTLGDKVLFLGYELGSEKIQAGGVIPLTLYWQAQQEMETSYKVFTHLVGPDGQIWGQKDSIPRNGIHPTTGWQRGEVVIDEYQIPVNPNAPAGEYAIAIGMYDPDTGRRLPARNAEGKRLPDDRILLCKVWLENNGG